MIRKQLCHALPGTELHDRAALPFLQPVRCTLQHARPAIGGAAPNCSLIGWTRHVTGPEVCATKSEAIDRTHSTPRPQQIYISTLSYTTTQNYSTRPR